MFEIIETNKSSVFFIGDIHGQFRAIGNWIKTNNLKNCALIFCGDFGLGFSSTKCETNELIKSNRICEENDVDCYVIRGNHDDPSYFNTNSQKIKLSRFNLLSDYTIIQTPNHNILCVGGAISIDRFNRKTMYEYDIQTLMRRKNLSFKKAIKTAQPYWWEDEKFLYNETKLDEMHEYGLKIDVVATHSAPDFCQPLTNPRSIGWTNIDDELENDLYNERNDITKLYKHLKEQGNSISYWFYGHYHMHNFEIIEGTKFIGLDMGRIKKNEGGPGGNFDMSELY